MRYDRARINLDRHPNYILAAYMAAGTGGHNTRTCRTARGSKRPQWIVSPIVTSIIGFRGETSLGELRRFDQLTHAQKP